MVADAAEPSSSSPSPENTEPFRGRTGHDVDCKMKREDDQEVGFLARYGEYSGAMLAGMEPIVLLLGLPALAGGFAFGMRRQLKRYSYRSDDSGGNAGIDPERNGRQKIKAPMFPGGQKTGLRKTHWILQGATTPNQKARRALLVSGVITLGMAGGIALVVRTLTGVHNFRELTTEMQRLGQTMRRKYGLNPLKTSPEEEKQREKWILEAEQGDEGTAEDAALEIEKALKESKTVEQNDIQLNE